MNSKTLFLISLFLAFSTATQCMKKEIILIPKTMQDIRDERDFIHNQSYHHEDPINNVLIYKNWYNFLKFLENRQIIEAQPNYDYDSLEDEPDLSWYQNYTSKGYSLVGLTTIALHAFDPSAIPSKKHVLFSAKKNYIPLLLISGFKKTEKDKYLALLTKDEEFGPVIIKKMLLLQEILLVLEIELPQEVRDIPLAMFEAEESLL